ncbi:hypothetical protein D9M72_391200 [compost metagenome]
MLVVRVNSIEQYVPDLGVSVQPGEGVVNRLPRGLVLRLQEAFAGDEREIIISKFDLREASLLVPERGLEGLLLDAVGTGVGEPLAQVHLPGYKRDQGRFEAPVGALHQFGQFLRFAAEELGFVHAEGEPEDQFIEEQDDGVVPQRLRVCRHGGEACVQVHILAGVYMGLEVRPDQGADQRLPLYALGRRGESSLVAVEAPAA